MSSVKCVVVGDGYVGKTSLIMTYCFDQGFPNEYMQRRMRTSNDQYTTTQRVDGRLVNLQLCDTIGNEDYGYERWQPMLYSETDVFIICFSLVTPSSMQNVMTKWLPEIAHHCPKTPLILVGTKMDLRDGNKMRESQIEGKKVAKKIKALKYLECSALQNRGLEEVFREATLAGLLPRKANKGRRVPCAVL